MLRRRENTFRIDYAHMPRKPSYEELHEFVNSELKLKKEDVVRIQPSRSLHCAFVKVSELSLAQKVVEEHDNKHETEIDGKTYKLRITLEDGAVDVKLFDLSEDVTNEKIIDFLRAYGEVLSIRELMWDERFTFGGIPTGVREVKMMIKENIPSFVTIDGEITALAYYGQQQTCRHCSEFVHSGISCVQNKKLLVQKLDSDQSYAKVVKQLTKSKQTHPHPTLPKPNSVQTRIASKPPVVVDIAGTKQQTTTKIAVSNKPTANPFCPGLLPSFKKPLQPCQTDTNKQNTAMNDREKDEGESDRSTNSTSSRSLRRRPPGKKPRHDGDDDSYSEDIL